MFIPWTITDGPPPRPTYRYDPQQKKATALLSTSETIHHSMSSFSLELATGCAIPTSKYCPHPKRCLPSLWSLERAAPHPPPDIIPIRNYPPLYVFLLFGACDGLRHPHLQILSTSQTIHLSRSSFSLELATGCATPPSRYYPHPKLATTLCPPSLWSLRRGAPRPPPDIIHIRN